MTLEKEFFVAEIMQVPAGAELRDFPAFPRGGSLVILTPEHATDARELNRLSAQVTVGPKVIKLRYAYWQVNARNEIGLLCDKVNEATIPLGSPVRFVKRTKN